MKWKYYPLPNNDLKAKKQILCNFSMGTYEQCPLSQRLLSRFSHSSGKGFAIAMELLDWDRITDYQWAGTYAGGKQLRETISTQLIPVGDRAIDGLVSFLLDWLSPDEEKVVVMENWTTKNTDITNVRGGQQLRFCKDTVYHVLTSNDRDSELIEDTIREPWNHWFYGVCAANVVLPESTEWSEKILDDVVANAQYIFVPAFDDEGFVVWSLDK